MKDKRDSKHLKRTKTINWKKLEILKLEKTDGLGVHAGLVELIGNEKHDQDIVNAMSMVDITKTSLQKMRDEGWNLHMDKVTSFMVKYGVEVPNMEANYIVPGRRMYRVTTEASVILTTN
ncbi:hypothetical protein POM88_044040 [Heracleum sosnowskyi]|uniref:Uncharacterized protein n=1 Tax=Heracleum sosnowskyi TaxID=360622 RepID=A0AAD8M3L7_9APIA|nr:hypothetical protein POM88_044040 [Heracleum sosnowskyi]